MKTIGIKLADGSFYPILQEGTPDKKALNLTTAKDDQTTVQVDLYRSETNSMEDAEYVDSLEIKNLKKHPNGEPDISLDISLDENNELSAELHDPETGKDSTTSVSLVSRTLAERSEPTEVNIADGIIEDDFDLDTSLSSSVPAESFASDEDVAFDPNSLNFDGISESEDSTEEVNGGAIAAGVAGAGLLGAAALMAEKNKEETAFDIPEPDDSDITLDAPASDDTISFDEPASDDGLSLDEPVSESMPDINFDEPVTDTDISFDEPAPSSDADIMLDAPASDDTISFDEPASDDGLSLDEPVSESMPDINFDEPVTDTDISFDEPAPSSDADITLDAPASDDDLNFDMPDFNDTSDNTDDMFTNETPSDAAENFAASSNAGLDFSDILDEETKEGYSGTSSEPDSIKKKTKTPVIICIVCAIICIIAVLLILFVIPSKLNIVKKCPDSKPAAEQIATEEKKEQPKIEAKENEVVVAPAKEVVPEAPKAKPASASKNISYKIKWGDTLWDIAKSYYGNPWKYKKIAKFNGIKNPDHIISGTVIVIPAE